MPTNVYVDGFNLYNGMFKQGRVSAAYKWLDVEALALQVWPHLAPVNRVRYFTALVKPTAADPNMVNRQQIYIRALLALGADVHYGQFKLRSKKWFLNGVLAQRPPALGAGLLDATVNVTKYEEKGSDVNLTSYSIRDAALKDCDNAIVISNDSDLVEAITIPRKDFAVGVYVVNPHARAVAEMRNAATDLRDLAKSALGKSQLPVTVTEANGTVLTKPPVWV